MKANELRIGNIIHQGGQYGELPISSYQIYQYSLGGFISSNNIPTYYFFWKPVPLTEEWLVRLGFIKRSEFEFKSPCTVFTVEKDSIGGFGIYKVCDIPEWLSDFKYVHQLQNLYYALTGEELTIK